MTIRYQAFADGEILTANNLLDLQNNGVVQVTSFSELAALDNDVNAAYVTTDGAFYVRKLDSSWGQVGGLAQIGASAPVAPQVGQIWYDTDAIFPNTSRTGYNGQETISGGSFSALVNLTAVSLTSTEPFLAQVTYGAVSAYGSDATTGSTMVVDISGSTTRAASFIDYAQSIGTHKVTIKNSFITTINAGTTLFTPQAKREGAGTAILSQPFIEVAALRWV
jgi:hypothetical protein